MCNVDYDPPSAYWERRPKARKAHTCGECRRQIEPGEIYFRASGIWDGSPNSYVMCDRCDVAREWLWQECHGFYFEMIGEDIIEHAREYRRSDLGRLAVMMRRKWKRFDGSGLLPVPKMPALSAPTH